MSCERKNALALALTLPGTQDIQVIPYCMLSDINTLLCTLHTGDVQYKKCAYTVTKPNDAIAFLRVVPWVFPFIRNNFFSRYDTCL